MNLLSAQVRRLKVYPGCKVRVMRAGDVIPKVIEVVPSSGGEGEGEGEEYLFELPQSCPSCGSPTAREYIGGPPREGKETTSAESVGVRCTGGLACPAQVIEQIA